MARVFSGARPTGRQHLGNYFGAIRNYVELQADHQCIYCVVDIHALTTLEEVGSIQENIREMVLDWLAAGLDPERSILFVQSHVPQVMELHTLLSMVTPLSWLTRVPTFKEKARLQPHNVNYGLVGYPVLMTADIVLYKAEVVPVGEDQLPHLELAREIVRRFHHHFGPTFPEPKAKLTKSTLVLGLDGQSKMSKSLNNHIELAASPDEIQERVMSAVTDPQRRYLSDPGRPEICNVHALHGLTTRDEARWNEIAELCRHARIGCVEHKKEFARDLTAYLAPFQERRATLAARSGYVEEILDAGANRARAIATETLAEVKEKMGLVVERS